ncbi:MAG: helix-turn-helix transcriptional regulator [Clostridiales bacterium]|nr:helix-turn-helix transcriptional regulator [Clostridiales bacterium]
MYVTRIGYNSLIDQHYSINRPNSIGGYLMLIVKTPAVFNIRGRDTTVKANSMILYKKGSPQFFQTDNSKFINDWFHFVVEDGEESFFDDLDIPVDEFFAVHNADDFSNFIKTMSFEFHSLNAHRSESVRIYLKLFFLKLSESLHEITSRSKNQYYSRLVDMRTRIYNEPHEKFTIEDLCDEMDLSRSRFQQLYKEAFGISVINDVIRSKIDYSKYLLTTTDLSVHQISMTCGYDNYSHFMRQFRSRVNTTPLSYRQKHAAKKPEVLELNIGGRSPENLEQSE